MLVWESRGLNSLALCFLSIVIHFKDDEYFLRYFTSILISSIENSLFFFKITSPFFNWVASLTLYILNSLYISDISPLSDIAGKDYIRQSFSPIL